MHTQHPPQAALGVAEDVDFTSCSAQVAESMGPDVMRSVLHLLPDIVEAMPVLLYQGRWHADALLGATDPPLMVACHCSTIDQHHHAGQFDVQDGPASCNDWIHALPWSHQRDFNHAPRKALRAGHVAANDWDAELSGHSVRRVAEYDSTSDCAAGPGGRLVAGVWALDGRGGAGRWAHGPTRPGGGGGVHDRAMGGEGHEETRNRGSIAVIRNTAAGC